LVSNRTRSEVRDKYKRWSKDHRLKQSRFSLTLSPRATRQAFIDDLEEEKG